VNAQAALAPGEQNTGLVTTETSGNVQSISGLGTSTPATASTPGAVANPELGGATGFSPGGAAESVPMPTGLISGLTSNTVSGDAASSALGIADTPDTSTLGSLLGLAKSGNGLVGYGLIQAGGSLLSGLTSTLTPAQVKALDAQAAANNAAAALQTQQTQNLAMPKAVASSVPVTGTPATLVPGASTQQTAATPSSGFINTAPKTAAVTGAPA
jgi:hypothetical protein